MAKYTTEQIAQEAKKTRQDFFGRKGGEAVDYVDVHGIRSYCDKVIFLVKRINTLERQLRKQKGK